MICKKISDTIATKQIVVDTREHLNSKSIIAKVVELLRNDYRKDMDIMDIIKFDLDKLSKENNGFAYYILGRSYDLEENGASQDYNKALKFYTKGLNLNYPLCVYSIGISYQLGLGDILPIDEVKAKVMLQQAYPEILKLIQDENADEMERLYAKFVTGAYYNWGLGDIKQDYKKAYEIIKSCADKGHIAAIYDLGYKFYHYGIGIKQSDELSKKYLNLAKDAGLKRAIEKYHEYGYDGKFER